MSETTTQETTAGAQGGETREPCPNAGRYDYARCLLPVGHPAECITGGRPNIKYAAFFRVVAALMDENDCLAARLSAGGDRTPDGGTDTATRRAALDAVHHAREQYDHGRYHLAARAAIAALEGIARSAPAASRSEPGDRERDSEAAKHANEIIETVRQAIEGTEYDVPGVRLSKLAAHAIRNSVTRGKDLRALIAAARDVVLTFHDWPEVPVGGASGKGERQRALNALVDAIPDATRRAALSRPESDQ